MVKEKKINRGLTLDDEINIHLNEYNAELQSIFKDKNYFKIVMDGRIIVDLILELMLTEEKSMKEKITIEYALKTKIPQKTKSPLYEIKRITQDIDKENITYINVRKFLKPLKRFLLSLDNNEKNEINNLNTEGCIRLIEMLPATEPPKNDYNEKNECIHKINESLNNLEKHLQLVSKENYAGAVIEGYNVCSLMIELFLKNEGYELKNRLVINDGKKTPAIEFCIHENMFPEECNEFLNIIEEYHNNFFKLSNSYELALSFLNGLSYFLLWFNNYYSEKYSIDNPFKIEKCYHAINKLTSSNGDSVIKINDSKTKKQKSEIIDINNSMTNFPNGVENLDSETVQLVRSILGEHALNIKNYISAEIQNATEPIKNNTEKIIATLDDIKEEIKNISTKITDYQSLISRQIKNFDTDEERDKLIAAFVDLCAEKIITEIKSFKEDDSYDTEKTNLVNIFGESWEKLSEESKTYLISSKLMLNNLNDMDNVDYSGVCILVTKTLEVELYKRFYEGFLNFLEERNYKKYENYPTGLLHKNKWLLDEDKFNLGTMAYIFCLKPENLDYYLEKNNREKLIEYCKSDLFKKNETDEIEGLIKKFGTEIEDIREHYRNPSAHRKNITKDKAEECLNIVLYRDDNPLLKEMLDSFKR